MNLHTNAAKLGVAKTHTSISQSWTDPTLQTAHQMIKLIKCNVECASFTTRRNHCALHYVLISIRLMQS